MVQKTKRYTVRYVKNPRVRVGKYPHLFYQVIGWFTFKNPLTGKTKKAKGQSFLFMKFDDHKKHRGEARISAMNQIKVYNWVVIHSRYRVMKWYELKKSQSS